MFVSATYLIHQTNLIMLTVKDKCEWEPSGHLARSFSLLQSHRVVLHCEAEDPCVPILPPSVPFSCPFPPLSPFGTACPPANRLKNGVVPLPPPPVPPLQQVHNRQMEGEWPLKLGTETRIKRTHSCYLSAGEEEGNLWFSSVAECACVCYIYVKRETKKKKKKR